MSKAEQLIKQQQKEQQARTDARVAKCTPVAHEILLMISLIQPSLDCRTQKKFEEEYDNVISKSIVAMKDADLTLEEASWVAERIANITDVIKRRVMLSLEKSLTLAEEVAFGKPTEEITLSELDSYIKKD